MSQTRRSGSGKATFHHKASDLDLKYQLYVKNHQYKCKIAKLVPERIVPVSDYSCDAQPGWTSDSNHHHQSESGPLSTCVSLHPWADTVVAMLCDGRLIAPTPHSLVSQARWWRGETDSTKITCHSRRSSVSPLRSRTRTRRPSFSIRSPSGPLVLTPFAVTKEPWQVPVSRGRHGPVDKPSVLYISFLTAWDGLTF